MGFGFFDIGYLISFFFRLSAQYTSFSYAIALLGVPVLAYGLLKLRRYQPLYRFSLFLLIPTVLFFTAQLLCDLFPDLFPPVLVSVFSNGGKIAEFLFLVAFLYATYRLCEGISLESLSSSCIFQMTAHLSDTIVFLLYRNGGEALAVLQPICALLNFVVVVLDAVLFLRCAKNIMPLQEDRRKQTVVEEKLNDILNAEEEKAIEKTRMEAEEKLRSRLEKRKNKSEKK